MKRIEVSILSPQEALNTFVDTWHRTSSGEKVTPRLAFESLGALFSAITGKRLELLRYVAVHEGLNVRKLAGALDRDYKNIHTDVKELTELGLLHKGDKGVLSAPFDEIVIHAGLRNVA